ncbi:MAG: hypothetical protein R2750_06240 [Bacteroidales bacterium]
MNELNINYIPVHKWSGYPVFRIIVYRLWTRHRINIIEYIGTMRKISSRPGEGMTFTIKNNSTKLKKLLKIRNITHDDKRKICDSVAAAATTGEGYREAGSPSLHFQVGKYHCNIHLDSYGFVSYLPNGEKFFNPELVQHTVDELIWGTYGVGLFDKIHPWAGKFANRFHPILPNSRNRYELAVGARFNVIQKPGNTLSIDYTVSKTGERRLIGKWEVMNW